MVQFICCRCPLFFGGWTFYGFIYLLVELGSELRALSLQSRRSTAWVTPPVYFALIILEMGGSYELFAWASLQL
jgi:hypothetical protein